MIREAEFFKSKRPWSKIKDKVIGHYLVPYLRKVSKLRRQIIIVEKVNDGSIIKRFDKTPVWNMRLN